MANAIDRRTFVKGGLLATAGALGYLPAGCSTDASGPEPGFGPALDSVALRDATSPPVDAPTSARDTGARVDARPAATGLPSRVLGKTGVSVPILGLGTVTLGDAQNITVADAARVYAEAIDRGITYIDTAYVYGRAHQAIGQVLKPRRKKTFLVTKIWSDSRLLAKVQFEDALKTLGTTYVDVVHLHSIGDRNVTAAMGKDGAWSYLLEQKKAGRARFVGITGHHRPTKFLPLLKTGEVDVMMVAMNFVDFHNYNFEGAVLAEARKQKTGVMAMKVFGGTEGGFAHGGEGLIRPAELEKRFDHAKLRDAIRYAKGLAGVTGMVIGMGTSKQLAENIKWATEAPAFTAPEMAAVRALGKKVAPQLKGRFG